MKKYLCLIVLSLSVSVFPARGFGYDNDQYNTLLEGVKAWNAMKSNQSAKTFDLSGADLQGADLRGAYLWRANLSWTRLKGVIVDARTILDTGKKATPEWAAKHGAVYR